MVCIYKIILISAPLVYDTLWYIFTVTFRHTHRMQLVWRETKLKRFVLNCVVIISNYDFYANINFYPPFTMRRMSPIDTRATRMRRTIIPI